MSAMDATGRVSSDRRYAYMHRVVTARVLNQQQLDRVAPSRSGFRLADSNTIRHRLNYNALRPAIACRERDHQRGYYHVPSEVLYGCHSPWQEGYVGRLSGELVAID
jgi:hypothetical protein